MKEAQALRDLSRRFRAPKSNEARGLVKEMTREHSDSLRAKAGSIRVLLARLSVEQRTSADRPVESGPLESDLTASGSSR